MPVLSKIDVLTAKVHLKKRNMPKERLICEYKLQFYIMAGAKG
jgi:hypothetical protein